MLDPPILIDFSKTYLIAFTSFLHSKDEIVLPGLIGLIPELEAREYGIPISANKHYDDYQNVWVEVFSVIARKGETIYTGQIIKAFKNRMSIEQMKAGTFIMQSTMEDPKVTADGKELGCIVTEFDNHDEDDMNTTLEFHFYETVIKAVVYRDKAPDLKQIHYITNYQ